MGQEDLDLEVRISKMDCSYTITAAERSGTLPRLI